MADAARCQGGDPVGDWRVEGAGHLTGLLCSGRGGVLLTAHMGNYDVAAPVFSRLMGKRLHAVRAPERQADTQAYREAQLRGQESETFAVHYNRPDNVVGVELAQALGRGELVAIQGDRVLDAVSPVVVPFGAGHTISVPRGPFVLASVAGAGIYPVLTVRLGWRRYAVLVDRPIAVPSAREGREPAVAAAAGEWVARLAPVARRYWFQWFVFEPLFQPSEPGPGTPPEPEPAGPGSDPGPDQFPPGLPAPPARDPEARATTALFKLIARLGRSRREPARPDRVWANRPGHDASECLILAALVAWIDASFAGAVLHFCLGPGWPLPGLLVVLLVIPCAFLWTHLVALALAGSALALRAAGLARRVPPDRLAGSLTLLGRTALAGWAVVQPGMWLRCAGWPWLVWGALQAAAWLALRVWPARRPEAAAASVDTNIPPK
jgi:lauroyl/myristoyl acyltransferase